MFLNFQCKGGSFISLSDNKNKTPIA